MPTERRFAALSRCARCAIAALLAGCAALADPARGLPNLTTPAPPGVYLIQPGDRLRIHFVGSRQFDDEFLVDTQGRVDLPFLGTMDARGQTLAELSRRLRERANVVKRPEVVVQSWQARGSVVTVGGEVWSPQRVESTRAATVAEAVRAAGGVLPSADPTAAVLLRRNLEGGVEAHRIDVSLDEGGLAERTALMPLDLIFVPKSRGTKAVETFEQYVLSLIPARTGFFALYAVSNPFTGQAGLPGRPK